MLRIAPIGRSRSLQVEQGIADLAIDVPPEEAQRLQEESRRIQLRPGGPVEVEAIVWNLDHAIWGSWELRREVISRLDSIRLVRAAGGGFEPRSDRVATGIIEDREAPLTEGGPPGFAGSGGPASAPAESSSDAAGPAGATAPADTTFPAETAVSAETMAVPASAAPAGFPALEILYDASNPRRERIAVEASLQLERQGFPVRLAPETPVGCEARMAGRRFDAAVVAWSIPAIPDIGEIWGSGGVLNVAGLRSAAVDSLIDVARSAAADTTPGAWGRVERRAGLQLPMVPIDRRGRIDALGPMARGYRADPISPYGDLLSLERAAP
jgi:hypothetical protein